MEFPFGPWLADGVDFRNPGLEACENVIPSANGYQPARALVSSGVSVPGTIIGASSAYLVDGAAIVLVATTADLYVLRSGTATASGLTLGLAVSDLVAFEQFGASVYATTKNGGLWVLDDIQTDNTFAAGTGSPPSGNAIARVADFLILGDLIDTDSTAAPYRIRWPRFNNPGGTWDTDIGAQSGALDLNAQRGPVTAITGGTSGLIFQTRGVSRITFTGGATVFSIDDFEQNRGCVAPGSAVQVGETTYYLAHDGFYRTEGTTPQPISTGRVWRWFLDNTNQTYIANVVGSVDFERRCIVWLFVGSDEQDRTYTGQLWYSWETDSWSNVDQAAEWIVQSARPGVTLEQLASEYPNLDTMDLSLDSPDFQASGRNLQLFSGGALCNASGATLAPKWTGGSLQLQENRRNFVEAVTPLVEADTASVVLGTRDRMTQTLTVTPETPIGPIGFAPFNHDGRYFRVTVTIPAGVEWSQAYGYQIEARTAGVT